jgi:hypothetical protein
VVWLLEHVASARERARGETWLRLAHLVGGDGQEAVIRRGELNVLLVTDPGLGRTPLRWLEAGPVSASPAAVKAELEKLATCDGWTPTPWICRCCRPSGAGSWPGWGGG